MKAKYIYEKFIEDTDPIQDMGIGMMNKPIDFKTEEDALEFLYGITTKIVKVNSIMDIFNPKYTKKRGNGIILIYYYEQLSNYWYNYVTINGDVKSLYSETFKKIVLKNQKKSVNEKFTEDSDPIKDMGIGMMNRPINFDSSEEFFEWLIYFLTDILGVEKIPKDILKSERCYLKEKYLNEIKDYLYKYIKVKNKKHSQTGLSPFDDKFIYWSSNLNKWLKQQGYEGIKKVNI